MREIQQLVLVKQFADEADGQLERDDDFGNGLAVSIMQEAVELFLQIVIRERSLPIDPRPNFDRLIAVINAAAEGGDTRVPHPSKITALNTARVNFKHVGTAPSRSDAVRLVRYGLEFLETACPRFFDIEYSSVLLAHLVKSDEVRAMLFEAEAKLAAGEHKDAVVAAADAAQTVQGTLGRLLPVLSQNHVGEAARGLLPYLNALRLLSLGALVKFDVRDLMRFNAPVPGIFKSPHTGSRQAVFNGPAVYTLEEANFAVRFARDFALAVQARLG